MFRRQLIRHIENQLKRDQTKAEIFQDLKNDGWPDEDINEAYLYAMHPEELKGFSFHRFLGTEVPVWVEVLTLFSTLMVITGVVTYFAYFQEKVYSYELSVSGTPSIERNILKYGSQPSFSDKNFFTLVEKQFIEQKIDFILADLADMKLSLYRQGKVTLEVPILTKGREGSWWETPAGLYKVETKEKKHFSSFGKVYQPWSMAFQGNFFIHGWPYYPDGKNVESTYSGGCIRLSNKDAEKIFSEAAVGMPILVYEKDFASDGYYYNVRQPSISATHYIAADLKSDFVFSQKDDHREVSIASLTKLMTALVATEYINLDKSVTITQSMLVPTSKARLKVGQKITAYQLLYPLLLESSNEAAEALAQIDGRREDFIRNMNEKAASIGMTHTTFTDPSGRDGGNVSTIEDLFRLGKYLYYNRSFVLHFTSGTLTKSTYGTSIWSDMDNYNDFVGEDGFIGGKVGESTPAGQVEISVFERAHGKEKRPIIFIVLGSENRKADITTLRDFVWNSFE